MRFIFPSEVSGKQCQDSSCCLAAIDDAGTSRRGSTLALVVIVPLLEVKLVADSENVLSAEARILSALISLELVVTVTDDVAAVVGGWARMLTSIPPGF